MDYYIQGNEERAEEIKATFEKLGVASDTDRYNYKNDNVLYFTAGGMIHMIDANGSWANLIKTHPGYKELELLVESEFKVGDWVVKKDGTTFYGGNYAEQVTLIEVGETGKQIWFSSKTWLWEDAIRLWTIQDAKDGDVLVTTKIRNCPFIYRKTGYDNDLAYYYAGVDGNGDFCEGCIKRTLYHFGPVANVAPATKEQRDLLFAKMKEAGYEWDDDKKELRKIQPHYDIANFKPFDKVLVRDNDRGKWRPSIFSYHIKGRQTCYPFCCIGNSFSQCIPFEGNEHLLGTTDMPDEMYINW